MKEGRGGGRGSERWSEPACLEGSTDRWVTTQGPFCREVEGPGNRLPGCRPWDSSGSGQTSSAHLCIQGLGQPDFSRPLGRGTECSKCWPGVVLCRGPVSLQEESWEIKQQHHVRVDRAWDSGWSLYQLGCSQEVAAAALQRVFDTLCSLYFRIQVSWWLWGAGDQHCGNYQQLILLQSGGFRNSRPKAICCWM